MEPATFKLLTSECKDLSLELAQSWQALTPSPTERDLNQNRLKMLQEKAVAGQLITFSWAKAMLGDKMFRVNGQHSSKMLVDLNGEFPAGLKVHIDTYEVADMQGLAQLFRQFDDKKSGRSSADIAGAFQNIEPELQEVPKAVGKLAIEGITFYRHTINKEHTLLGDLQYNLFHDVNVHDFIKWTADIIDMKTPEMKHKAVVGAMWISFTETPDEARKFWQMVARGGDQYEETSPATLLDDWLKRISDKEEKKVNKVTPPQIYNGCMYAYNAFLKGQTVKGIKYDTSKGYYKPVSVKAA